MNYFEYANPNDGPIRIAYTQEGSGPPLLLLHGFPQTQVIWHKIKPQLAQHFTVITSDLRGYGESSKPQSRPGHDTYSKREMARDQVALMKHLGYERFSLVGHDRGGRVSHRLVIDHPGVVDRLMVMDISPTLTMYEQTTMAFAKGYWHWFFLIQPEPIPETMINANPVFFLENHMAKYKDPDHRIFSKSAWDQYVSCIQKPEHVHAMCEDYRAASTIDLEHDRLDRCAGKKIEIPLRVLWGQEGLVNRCFSPLTDWQAVATNVSGQTLPGGHYMPEDAPNEVTSEILQFFRQ